jgi:PBP1b-binding outer membrane lipoprotein LpoB
MKKILILLVALILTGCSSDKENDYYFLIDQLKDAQVSAGNFPFDIEISLDKITDDEIMYNAIIDNPIEPMKNIRALIIHDKITNNMFPSIGVFDKRVNLIPNVVDEVNNNVKGIALVGYLPYDGTIENYTGEFKVLVEYTNSDNKFNMVYYIYKI